MHELHIGTKESYENVKDFCHNTLVFLSNLKYFTDEYFDLMIGKFTEDLNIYDEKQFKDDVIEEMKVRKFLPKIRGEAMKTYTTEKLHSIIECLKENLLVKPDQVSEFQRKYATSYKQFISSEEDGFQLRYYVLDILTELVATYDEIKAYCPSIDQQIMNNIIEETLLFIGKNLAAILSSKTNKDIKQLWLEVEFFQNLTARFHGKQTQNIVQGIFSALKKVVGGEIASEDEKKKIIRLNKFKNERNFDILINY